MRRVIGIDIHRTFGEVVTWEDGKLRNLGRVEMTRTALEGLGGKLLSTDEVVICEFRRIPARDSDLMSATVPI